MQSMRCNFAKQPSKNRDVDTVQRAKFFDCHGIIEALGLVSYQSLNAVIHPEEVDSRDLCSINAVTCKVQYFSDADKL